MTGPVFKLNVPDDRHKIQPLPIPPGRYPYHRKLEDEIDNIPKHKLVFHLAGDTGSIILPSFQGYVSAEMAKQIEMESDESSKPQFFFHLGDIVYNHGAERFYYDQFFKPFSSYPAPIFAIPGNHDAAIDPFEVNPPDTLDAYLKVFCSKKKQLLPIAGDSGRLTMTEPNVYWSLDTPVATIIGMYTNVNKYGYVDEQQKAWLVAELIKAKGYGSKATLLCLHHSPYSADMNHGASKEMIYMLESCFEKAGVRPDIIFSGHVHNYQRFEKTYEDGQVLPYIVAGAGGYADLHPLAPNTPEFTRKSRLFDNVRMLNSCDECHGFMRLSIERTDDSIAIQGNYYTVSLNSKGNSYAAVKDSFEYVLPINK